MAGNILIVYYSRTQNMATITQLIQAQDNR
jgi:hypothetical protein